MSRAAGYAKQLSALLFGNEHFDDEALESALEAVLELTDIEADGDEAFRAGYEQALVDVCEAIGAEWRALPFEEE